MSDKSPFPAGFERDAKTLMLAHDQRAISREELRMNLKRLNVELIDEVQPRTLQTPQLERPVLERPQLEEGPPRYVEFDDDHFLDLATGYVHQKSDGAIVGYISEDEPEDMVDGEDAYEIAVEPAPADDEELEIELIPDTESPGIVIPEDVEIPEELQRPAGEDDEQVDGGAPE